MTRLSYLWLALNPSERRHFLDCLLLGALVVSYIPLAFNIVAQRSVAGFSTSYMLFNTLFATSQFTMIIWYLGQEYPAPLKGLKATRPLLNLIHSSVLWLGSLFLFLAWLCLTPATRSLPDVAQDPAYPDTSLSRRAVAIICFIYMVVFLVPAVLNNLDSHDGINGIAAGFLHMINHALLMIPTLIFLVQTTGSQSRYMLAMSAEALRHSCLSPSTFAAQCVLYICVGASLFYRLQRHNWEDLPNPRFSRANVIWGYFYHGWSWMNMILYGTGQGLLAVLYLAGVAEAEPNRATLRFRQG